MTKSIPGNERTFGQADPDLLFVVGSLPNQPPVSHSNSTKDGPVGP